MTNIFYACVFVIEMKSDALSSLVFNFQMSIVCQRAHSASTNSFVNELTQGITPQKQKSIFSVDVLTPFLYLGAYKIDAVRHSLHRTTRTKLNHRAHKRPTPKMGEFARLCNLDLVRVGRFQRHAQFLSSNR